MPRSASRILAMGRGLGACALAASLVVGCSRGEAPKAVEAPPPPPTVVVAQVTQRTVPLVRDFVAHTEAVPTVDIRARVAGVLEEIRFREGSAVEQGQVLFVIQQTEYQAALQSARADPASPSQAAAAAFRKRRRVTGMGGSS